MIGWELGTRQTSHPSFSGKFFISFFFAALFNNHVSFCGYYTSFSSLWALLCIPLSSRCVFLCHFGVIPYLWWFCWVILSFGLFWRVFQCVCRCYSWVLVLMNIFDWVLSSFRFYHYSAVHVLGFIRVSLLLLSRCHYIRCRCVTSCFIWFVLCVSCDVLGFTSFVSWWMISFTYTLVSAAVSPVCPFQFKFKKLKHQSVSFWIKPLMRLWVLRLT